MSDDKKPRRLSDQDQLQLQSQSQPQFKSQLYSKNRFQSEETSVYAYSHQFY